MRLEGKLRSRYFGNRAFAIRGRLGLNIFRSHARIRPWLDNSRRPGLRSGLRLILENAQGNRNADDGNDGRSRESTELPLMRRPPRAGWSLGGYFNSVEFL